MTSSTSVRVAVKSSRSAAEAERLTRTALPAAAAR
jgi:hypothetical protein